MKRRFLSVLLALMLVIVSVPTGLYAEGGTEETQVTAEAPAASEEEAPAPAADEGEKEAPAPQMPAGGMY
jgi:hypothetical protein